MTPERAMYRVRELRQEHTVARAADCSLVKCAVLIREAETLEREVRIMRAKMAERDGRVSKCALANPELTLRQLGERFGISWQAVSAILDTAGVAKGDLNGQWHRREDS